MKRILVVDDEENIRELYRDELIEEGFEVLTASNGAEALSALESIKGDVNLVMLDIRMPGMSGLETLGRIKELYKSVPVILLSAYDTYKQDFTSWAAEDYIVKSSDLKELKEKIGRYTA
jgi:DNA-binding response OmpR family regulator